MTQLLCCFYKASPPPYLNPFFNINLINWNCDDVTVILTNDEYDEEEEIPTPTVKNQVIIVGRKKVYSLFDENESDEYVAINWVWSNSMLHSVFTYKK